jgi:cytoskeleton protein RodZ
MARSWNEAILDIEDVPADALSAPQDTVAGSLIARARADLRLGIADVVRAIGLKEAYLRAIEAGEYWKLPSVSYGLAYVKSYARFVGLDPDLIADQFKAELADMPPINGLSKQANELDFSRTYMRATRDRRRWLAVLERIGVLVTGLVVVGAVAAYFAWRFYDR